jgi:hypothetical protein
MIQRWLVVKQRYVVSSLVHIDAQLRQMLVRIVLGARCCRPARRGRYSISLGHFP